jgi:hypothetical protein
VDVTRESKGLDLDKSRDGGAGVVVAENDMDGRVGGAEVVAKAMEAGRENVGQELFGTASRADSPS